MVGDYSNCNYRFPTTHWSLIGQAGGEGGDNAHRAALSELLVRYLPSLRAHLVIKKRIDVHEAEDLVQGFVANKVLERNLVGMAEAGRGRFRSLLATALDNYVANERQRHAAKKRAADRASSLDEPHQEQLASHDQPPSNSLDVEWGKQVLSEALRRLRAECQVTGQLARWQVFELRVLKPVFEDRQPLPYDEVVDHCGFLSPTQASNALITAKRAFARVLREVVAEYAQDEQEVEEELRDLRLILSGAKH
jgi:hypothetical protein